MRLREIAPSSTSSRSQLNQFEQIDLRSFILKGNGFLSTDVVEALSNYDIRYIISARVLSLVHVCFVPSARVFCP